MTLIDGGSLEGSTLYTECTVIDPGSDTRIDDAVIAVRDGMLVGLGPRPDFPVRSDGIVQSLAGGYVLPGLFNCHAHVALDGDNTPYAVKLPLLKEMPEESRILTYLEQGRKNLSWGVTSVRDLHPGPAGGRLGFDLVRRLTDSAAVPGARLFLSGPPLVVAGGHGTHWMSRMVSGADDVVRAVREAVYEGSDCIKLMAAFAWGPLPDEPASWGTYFTPEELRAAVETAHAFGVPVAAHTHGESTLRSVIEAGVDSVEHGSGLTSELCELMADRGTFLVPTLASYDNISANGQVGGLDAKKLEQAAWVRGRQRRGFELALEVGVRIAAGSDAGFHMLPHGESLIRELELYTELGMAPLDVLRTATTSAAELVGVADQLGTLQTGFKADFIVCHDDPSTDVSNLRSLELVVVGGVQHLASNLREPFGTEGAQLRQTRRTYVASSSQNSL